MVAVLVPVLVLAMLLVLAPVPVSAVLLSVPVSAVKEPAVLVLAVPVLRPPPQQRRLPQRLGLHRPSES